MPNLSRWLSVVALVLVLLLAAGGFIWYFAYGVGDAPPGRAALAGLSGPVEVGWHEQGFATIEAQTEQDALAGLGYAQGVERTWTLLLLRQAALGQQAEWFGDKLLSIDRLSRRLGFATYAEAAYDSLTDENKALLQSYTEGVNAALRSRAVRLSEEVSLLRLEPEPWEPWHTLAVERLFAWIVTPPISPDSVAQAGTDAQAFFQADAQLRRWLHLHGFEHSTAWAVRDSTGTHFYQRQVYGNTALPFYFEATLTWPGSTLTGGSIPGTPFFVTGKTPERFWALLPHNQVQLEYAVDDTTGTKHYERIRSRAGNEALITVRHTGSVLFFDPPPRKDPPVQPDTVAAVDSLAFPTAPDTALQSMPGDSLQNSFTAQIDSVARVPDSTWVLRWSGLNPVSDLDAWRSLVSGESSEFRLLQASGLMGSPSGDWQVLGTPPTVAALSRGIVVGNTPWTLYIAQALDSLVASNPVADPQTWALDYRSAWAEQLAPSLIAAVDTLPDQSPVIEEALTYLRNWDFAYDPASIAAPIFDTWVSLYRDSTGIMPTGQVPDTVYFENLLRYQMLAIAVNKLRGQYGSDLSQWRWEVVYPGTRYFPVFSADSLLDEELADLASERFKPVELPGSGHPSALAWGLSPILEERPHPSVWEAWVSTASWDDLRIRRRFFEISGFLSRYRISERPPVPAVLSPAAEPDRTTTLTPAAS